MTPDGRRCAVGLCIPDSSPLVDTKASFCGLIYADRREFDRLFYVPGLDDTLLVNFQKSLHDDLIDRKNAGEWGYNREERAAKYREVAEKFGLEQHR